MLATPCSDICFARRARNNVAETIHESSCWNTSYKPASFKLIGAYSKETTICVEYLHNRDQLQCPLCMLASLITLEACPRQSSALPGVTSFHSAVYKQAVSDTSSLAPFTTTVCIGH